MFSKQNTKEKMNDASTENTTLDSNDLDLKPKAKRGNSLDSNDDDLKPKAKRGKMDTNTGISKGTLEVEKTNDVCWQDV